MAIFNTLKHAIEFNAEEVLKEVIFINYIK